MDTRNQFGRAVSVLNRQASAYFARELKPLGIGPGQQAYLLAVEPGEQIHQEALAGRLQVDKANVARALAGLEQQGLVLRRVAPHDKRTRHIRLTPQGEQVRAQVRIIASHWVARLQQAVDQDEWDTLVNLLQRVADAAAAPAGDPARSR